MIYTYEDVVKKANDTGLSGQLTQSDWDAAQKSPDYGISLLQLMQDASGADSEEKKLLANHAVNALRQSFGTSVAGGGTAAGKVNELLGKVDSYGSFNYSKDPQYQQLLKEALNPEKFSYDPETDVSYAALQKAYRREGDRAIQDTMAKAAAATGGVPSSYAVTAAQQAGNYYAAQLADRLPEMEQNAYQKYLNDITQKLNLVGVMQTDKQQEQTDWQNNLALLQNQLGNWQQQADTEYSQGLNGANMAYQILQNAIAQEQQEKENIWKQQQLDNAAAQQEQENIWYQQQLDNAAAQQEVTNALALMQTLGYATPEIAQVLGIREGTKVVAPGGDSTPVLTEGAQKLYDLGLDAANAEYIVATYPDGVITDGTDWDILLGTGLSEGELNELGYKLPVLDYDSAVSLLGRTAGKRNDVVSALIDEGILETYVEGGLLKVKKGANWTKRAAYLLNNFGIDITGGRYTAPAGGGGMRTTNAIKLD